MVIRTVLAAVFLGTVAAAVQAHHGISNWDLNTDITVTGRLTEIELINPHSWIHLEVRGADGRTASWKCEMRSANALRRSGWTKEMFRVGSSITVTGSPERRKPNQCYLGTILFADGSSMDRYGQYVKGGQGKIQEVRGPVKGPRGLHVFQVLELKKEATRPFDEVKEQLREQVFTEEMDKQTKVWLEELRRKAHVEVKL